MVFWPLKAPGARHFHFVIGRCGGSVCGVECVQHIAACRLPGRPTRGVALRLGQLPIRQTVHFLVNIEYVLLYFVDPQFYFETTCKQLLIVTSKYIMT